MTILNKQGKIFLIIAVLIFTLSSLAADDPELLNGEKSSLRSGISVKVIKQSFDAGLYLRLNNHVNLKHQRRNWYSDRVLEQAPDLFARADIQLGLVWQFQGLENLEFESILSYFPIYEYQERQGNWINSLESRNQLVYVLGNWRLQYRLVLWNVFEHSKQEPLYTLVDPAQNPMIADQNGRYYLSSYQKVRYANDVWLRHLVGFSFPSGFARNLDFFIHEEIYLLLTARKDNEFKQQVMAVNHDDKLIAPTGQIRGFRENILARNRIYVGSQIKLGQGVSSVVEYILESDRLYNQEQSGLFIPTTQYHYISLRVDFLLPI